MKIWELQEDVNIYEHLTLVNSSSDSWDEFSDMFDGKKLNNSWKPLQLMLIEHGGKLKKGDMPYLSPGVPILSEKAIETLKDLLINKVEILPVEFSSEDYKIINVTNVIECLDYTKSEIKRYRNSERIMCIYKYAFRTKEVLKEHIFKIVEQPRNPVFVSDEFRNRVLNSGLKGFKFVEVWDSEE